MATNKSKSNSKIDVKKKPVGKTIESEMFDAVLASFLAATTSTIDKRKELLARVAGSIAAGLVTSPSPSIATPATMAMAAVDIAAEILKLAGIPAEPSAESASPTGAVGAGAA